MLCHQFPLCWGLIMCTCPYCNDRIITVIHNMSFIRGTNSFSTCFANIFRQCGISPVHHEIPLPLVCLVATAVSWQLNALLNSMLNVFSAICCHSWVAEWRAATHQLHHKCIHWCIQYVSNVHLLQHIIDSNKGKYHHIMEDIYTLARSVVPKTSIIMLY